MNSNLKRIFTAVLTLPLMLSTGCVHAESAQWRFGFGCRDIHPDFESGQPLYIAGYNQGAEISGVLDLCQAKAVWIDAGGKGILIIGVDSIALSSGTVEKIRTGLADVKNCAAINVFSTHDHASADTLGLWGPTGVDGKNAAYMDAMIEAAIAAGREAAASVKPGELRFGQAKTKDMLRDSRYPEVCDDNLYQLRFTTPDGPGLRMLFYCAHAESLRSANRLLSRDFPGVMCDLVSAETGDDAMFLPGAVGGLLMTREFFSVSTPEGAQRNLQYTGEQLASYALSIRPEDERVLEPKLDFARTLFTVPLDNPAFLMYRFLGILNNKALPGESATGYMVESELAVLRLGGLTIALLPGELFPELAYGGKFGDANPEGVNPPTLTEIARKYGMDPLLIIGLCNDELGYIVPPSDFLLNEETPYIARTRDSRGEDHYEETNSVGPQCADAIASAFEKVLAELDAKGE